MRLRPTFEALRARGEKALVTYLTAGDPTPALSLQACRAALRAGADVLELGIPFSDPMADGPAIQRASERALAAGMNVRGVLEMCRTLRAEFSQPIVLFGYYNPLLAFGIEAITQAAADAGADAFLVVDLPPEESDELASAARRHGQDLIYLLAPTSTPARIELVRQRASGFVYYVSMTGVTGAKLADLSLVMASARRIGDAIALPLCVGFGISSPDEARQLAGAAEGVVVGSVLVRLCEQHAGDESALVREVETLVRHIKAALRGA